MSLNSKLLLAGIAVVSLLFWIYFTKIALIGFAVVALFMYGAYRNDRRDES